MLLTSLMANCTRKTSAADHSTSQLGGVVGEGQQVEVRALPEKFKHCLQRG